MKQNQSENKKSYLIITTTTILIFVLSCVTSFEPEYSSKEELLVVDGCLIKGFDQQVIKISRSSPIDATEQNPVGNCNIKIVDNDGKEFYFTEESLGKYTSNINDNLLIYNNKYKLVICAPSGETYESAFQTLLETAPVDNIYSTKESGFSSKLEKETTGMRFYVDLNAPADASKYYRWRVVETWETHAKYVVSAIFDGVKTKILKWPTDSIYRGWITDNNNGIFTLATENLSENVAKKIPLHFKESTSQDLTIKYCATIQQFALNKDAYIYWQQKNIDLTESGNIYTSQPASNLSNIHNTDNPGENILGFFWVSSYTQKRLFLTNPFSHAFETPTDSACKVGLASYESINGVPIEQITGSSLENILTAYILKKKYTQGYPVFLYKYGTGDIAYYFPFIQYCIDVRKMGATIIKPDFW